MSSYPEVKSQKRIQKAYSVKRDAYTRNGITFVTPSNWLKDIVQSSFLRNEDVRVIHNGVAPVTDIQESRSELCREEGIAPDKKLLLFIAAAVDSEYKGYRYLKQALKALPNKQEYTVLVIGTTQGMSDLEENLDIRYLGYISDPERMHRYYALADVFILPSVAENFPCVILEAMACGTPVIAFDVGGIREQVDETTGWLVKEKDSDALCKAISDAFSDEALLRQKAQNCKKVVKERFTEEIMLEEYRQLYHSI